MTERIIRADGQREAVQITFPVTGRTKQSFRDECDINCIMAKWTRTGAPPVTNPLPPQYGDFSNVDDYLAAANSVLQADLEFSRLPAEVRDRFQNDPAQLITFMADPGNQDEAVALGLADAPRPPDPVYPPGYTKPEPDPDPTPPTGESTPPTGETS